MFVKFLGIDRPLGKKVTRVEPGCEPILFGWQAIPDDAREVVIEEGELNALSLWDYGRPALGVPFGAGGGAKQRWIESEYVRLQRFETIYLRFDEDKPGADAINEILPRLGRHRCRVVTMPGGKDPNDCLIDGVPKVDIDAAFASARTMDPEGLRPASAFTDEVVELFWPSGGEERGYSLPWAKARGKVLFRPGEVTVWHGATGAGKSQALTHACVDLADQGARICIASLEMAPGRTLRRMVKQASDTDRPTEELIHETLRWLGERVWLFDVVGKSKVSQLLEIFEYARRRYGVDVFVIDSFMRLGIAPDDYAAQDKAIFEIVDWAVSSGVHVHLVAHSRKGDMKTSGAEMTAEDVKGTSEIASNAANIIGVWRNRKREKNIELWQDDPAKVDQLRAEEEKPGVVLTVSKQRNGDWEGVFGLWFNVDTYQYRSSRDAPHRQYVSLQGSMVQEAMP